MPTDNATADGCESLQFRMRWFRAGQAAVLSTLALLTASPASSQREPQVIRVLSVGRHFYPIQRLQEHRPLQIGESYALGGSLYAWAGQKRGKRVGRFEGQVTVVTQRRGHLSTTEMLPGGTLAVAGGTPLFEVPVERQAVIGGTGRFAGARGTLTVRDIRGPGDKAALTFRLLQ